MQKSSIQNTDGNISIEITKEDLTYALDELEKLYLEGGQFSIRIKTKDEEDALIIFQKVEINKDNQIEIVNIPTIDSMWPLYILLSISLFCFITILYAFYQLIF